MSQEITPFEVIRRTNPQGGEFWAGHAVEVALAASQVNIKN